MECDICFRSLESAGSVSCAACSRNQLYPLRVQHAQLLLEKSNLGQQIDGAVVARYDTLSTPRQASKKTKVIRKEVEAAAKGSRHDNALDELSTGRASVEKITRQVEIMRQRNDELRAMIEAKRKENAEWKARLEQTTSAHGNVQPAVNNTLSKSGNKDADRQIKLSASLVGARTFLCRKAAAIMGLDGQQTSPVSGGRATRQYSLGFMPALDLRKLAELPPETITTSLAYTIRLVHLTCQYLSVRIPAEVIHPHNNYPYGTIFWPNSSYLIAPEALVFPHPYLHEPHPGSGGASPKASRELEKRGLPRSRPLFVYQKLSVLVKDDPQGFSHFVEGVSLLAWDVAWLCRSQGLAVAEQDWDEVAAVGKNLWRLLAAPVDSPSSRPGSNRRTSSKHVNLAAAARIPAGAQPTPTPTFREDRAPSPVPKLFGHYSHSSIKNLIKTPVQAGTMPEDDEGQRWKFYNPHKVIDKVKSFLMQEISGAEWEVLDDDDFYEAKTEFDDKETLRGSGAARQESGDRAASSKGQKGYMKLRERSAA